MGGGTDCGDMSICARGLVAGLGLDRNEILT